MSASFSVPSSVQIHLASIDATINCIATSNRKYLAECAPFACDLMLRNISARLRFVSLTQNLVNLGYFHLTNGVHGGFTYPQRTTAEVCIAPIPHQ